MRRELKKEGKPSFFLSNARPRARRAFFPLVYSFNNFPGASLYNLTIDKFPEMWYNSSTEREVIPAMMDKKKLAEAYLYWKIMEKKATDEAERKIAQENQQKIKKLSEKVLTKT